MEFPDASRMEDIDRCMIVEAAPLVSRPRVSDRNIAIVAKGDGGSYRPSRHLEQVRDPLAATGKTLRRAYRGRFVRTPAILRHATQ